MMNWKTALCLKQEPFFNGKMDFQQQEIDIARPCCYNKRLRILLQRGPDPAKSRRKIFCEI